MRQQPHSTPMPLSEPLSDPAEARSTTPPRSSRAPGTGLSHEVLVALIMAIAMAATVFLYR